MPFTHLSSEQKERREQDLARMRLRFQKNPPRLRGRVVTERVIEKKVVAQKPRELTPHDLAHAIRIAIQIVGQNGNKNPVFLEALETAAAMFDELEKPAVEEQEESEPPQVWKQIDSRTFAIQSDNLQMTEEGLRIAMYQIPKPFRKGLLRWRWKRRYRDREGKLWLEFHSPLSEAVEEK